MSRCIRYVAELCLALLLLNPDADFNNRGGTFLQASAGRRLKQAAAQASSVAVASGPDSAATADSQAAAISQDGLMSEAIAASISEALDGGNADTISKALAMSGEQQEFSKLCEFDQPVAVRTSPPNCNLS